jgi:hypothetical protein
MFYGWARRDIGKRQVKADQGVGRGRGVRPIPATQSMFYGWGFALPA